MGWSCAATVSDTLERWQRACIKSTGMQNTYTVNRRRYPIVAAPLARVS